MKLHLLAALSMLSLVLSILVFAGFIDDGESLGVQYLVLGLALAVLYFALGGFRAMRLGRLGRSGDESDAKTPEEIIDLRDGVTTAPTHRLTQDPPPDAHVVRFGQTGLEPAEGWDLGTQVTAAVRRREEQLVDRMVAEGMLTTDGPLTHTDIRAMAWVAVSSMELTDSLLDALSGPAEVEIVDPQRPGELLRGDPGR